MLFAFMILVLTIFLLLMGEQYVSVSQDQTRNKLSDIRDVLDSELTIGAKAQDGYYRQISVPDTAGGVPFKILFYNSTTIGAGIPANYSEVDLILVNSSVNFETYIYLPPNVNGNISHGAVELRKQNGVLYIMNLTT